MDAFSSRLKSILNSRGLTQSSLADGIEVSRQHISHLINGHSEPTPQLIIKISKFLNIDPKMLESSSLEKMFETALPPANDSFSFSQNLSYGSYQGIDEEYLRIGMRALQVARDILLLSPIKELRSAVHGKKDTLSFDAWTEVAIVEELKKFNKKSAIFTEERRVLGLEHANTVSYFVDPFDRSKFFQEKIMKIDEENSSKTVAELLDEFRTDLAGIAAPVGSITCVREGGRLVYNVILDYISGVIYVASRNLIKFGFISKCPDPKSLSENGREIIFAPRTGFGCTTFLGDHSNNDDYDITKAQKYKEIYKSLAFKEEHGPPKKHSAPGGPLRVLYLANDFTNDFRPSFILSNGEKIGEWLGWLAYAIFSEQLAVFELFSDPHQFIRDEVLMAPPPNYSALTYGVKEIPDYKGIGINFERIIHLKNPSRYRGAIVVTHKDSAHVAVKIKSSRNARQLFPFPNLIR